MCLGMELCCQGWEADSHLMPFEFCPVWKYYQVKMFSHNCRKYMLSSKLMTPRCLLLPESGPMNAKDEEGQGPVLLFGRISCCDAFNITSTQFLTPLFLGGRCLVEGIKNASLFLIKQTNKKPFAYRSLPHLVCDARESPADLTGDAPSSTSRVRMVIPLSSSAWTVHRNSTLNSSPSTHNPNKREGSGINITTVCKSVKSYLFPLFPL